VAVRTVGGIEDIARQGLIELNRIVGALRRDEHEQLDRRPQPRLDDLPDLVDGARSAGLPVRLEIAGPPRSLPATVELAAYRVVQESLTNGGTRGLQGLTERAQLLGGTLQAGPRPGGGFSVRAWLPASQ